MKIEIKDSLYEKYRQVVKERNLTEDVASSICQLIEQELWRIGAPGYEVDPLTKCKTRYQLEKEINRATWGNSWQDHSPYENDYLCLDVDNFKSFLDSYGLIAGDEVLKEIAQQLREQYSAAHVYRLGGDEFAVELRGREYEMIQTPAEIHLKHSVVRVRAQRNQHRNHHINRVIMFYLDKGIVEASGQGTEIICEI